MWATSGVALGYDENGLFEPYIGEGNVNLPARGRGREPEDEQNLTKPYVETRSLYARLLYLLPQCGQLSVEVRESSSMLISGMVLLKEM